MDETPAEQLTEAELQELPGPVRDRVSKAYREAAKYRTELRERDEFIQNLGGKDRLEYLDWAVTSQEGIKGLFKEIVEHPEVETITGVSKSELDTVLKKTEKQVQAEVTAAEKKTGEQLTPEQLEELVAKRVDEALSKSNASQELTQLRTKVTSYLSNKGYTDPDTRNFITQLAAKHEKEVDVTGDDPFERYAQALDKGIADFEERAKTVLSKTNGEYLQSKASDRAETPQALTGSSPATGEKWDPSEIEDWAELDKEARTRGYAG